MARDVGSKVEKAEKPEVPKFVVDRYTRLEARIQIFDACVWESHMCEVFSTKNLVHLNFAFAREKTCPLLLRVFCSQHRHNNMSEYMRGISHS